MKEYKQLCLMRKTVWIQPFKNWVNMLKIECVFIETY